ncbi:MAG: hypothetical protein IJ455_08570 [Agathobacter sp.]|nr:hypothetical protein [Agathobacter sp.]
MVWKITLDEMKRILSSFGFWLSVGLALLILLTSQIHKDLDGTVYTVLSATYELEREQMIIYNLSVEKTLTGHIIYQLSMYGPLFAALSFATVLCEEQKYGVRRYLLFKEGKKRYVISKALTAVLTSGLCFLVIGLLFLVFLYWNYPMRAETSPDYYIWYVENRLPQMTGLVPLTFDLFGEGAFIILSLMGAFLYGVFCGFIGFICTAFFSNIYLAVCIPFFFGYIYYSIVSSFDGRLLEGSVTMENYIAIHSYVSPEGYVQFWEKAEYCLVNMVVLVAVWIAAIVIHLIYMQKASDCGVSR